MTINRHTVTVAALVAYCLGFWITFGHAFVLLGVFAPLSDMCARVFISAFCSLAWPLYWSGWLWAHLA